MTASQLQQELWRLDQHVLNYHPNLKHVIKPYEGIANLIGNDLKGQVHSIEAVILTTIKTAGFSVIAEKVEKVFDDDFHYLLHEAKQQKKREQKPKGTITYTCSICGIDITPEPTGEIMPICKNCYEEEKEAERHAQDEKTKWQ